MDIHIKLELQSVPESVHLVRSVIRTAGRASELERRLLDDLSTAVSEACNNVVLHAYPLRSGPLTFTLMIRPDQIEAVVRDRGCGMRRVSIRNRGLGMGVVVINALADQTEFQTDPGTGTEVRMRFKRPVLARIPLIPPNLGVLTLPDLEASVAPGAPSG